MATAPRPGYSRRPMPRSPRSHQPTSARQHVLDVPFAMRAVATTSGARWDVDHGVFVLVGDELPPALAPFAALPFSWELHVQRELEEARGGAPREPPARRRPESPAAAPSVDPIVLRPHQEEAVRAITAARAAGSPGFLLADDVGLGKTISAWKAALAMDDVHTVLIVCPLAVVAHWRRTLEAMGDGGKDVVILNYERLGKLFEVTPEARKRIRSKKGLARAGTAPDLDLVVWDESHRRKNPTAARSRLAAKIDASAGFRLWLSATAGQNPLDLSYLAPLLASATGSRASDLKDFEQWCTDQGLGVTRGAYGKWDWQGDPADCERVRALLFDRASIGGSSRAGAPSRPPIGLRRRPEEIAGWPAIHRILTPVDLDAEARALYAQAWTTFRREMELAPRGRDPRSALAATLRLRQKSSLLRASGTVALARELLENGHQVAISVSFVETLGALRDELQGGLGGVACAAIHGALDPVEREAERLRFQRGDARVVLFTVEEGISLHQGEHGDAPRSAIVHDLRWSAIQMAQIEGRCHRDGRFAQVYWVYADGTIEERIAQIVARRIQSMKEMVGDDVETLRAIEALLDEG